jgi:hypothetical protein
MEWGFDISACYVRMHDGTSKIWDEEVSQPNLLYFARDLPKMVFRDHFGQWFQTIVSPSILDGLA